MDKCLRAWLVVFPPSCFALPVRLGLVLMLLLLLLLVTGRSPARPGRPGSR